MKFQRLKSKSCNSSFDILENRLKFELGHVKGLDLRPLKSTHCIGRVYVSTNVNKLKQRFEIHGRGIYSIVQLVILS